MSTTEQFGPPARNDRSDSPQESGQDRKFDVSRLRWLGMLLLAPLLLVPLGWIAQDSAERSATLEAITVTAPAATLPLHVNPRVERWMEAFETTRKEEFEALLARREIYADMIQDKLRERGMPEDLLYIPMIESGLSPFAVSRVSAVGMWQFMSPTALQYGLRVDEYIDERRDPVRATDAALDYLQWLHGRFGGSWYLAAAAFNAGPGRVERILARHAEGRVGDEEIFWEIREFLPRETREYVPKMIAVTVLARDADAIGFVANRYDPYRYDTVFVPGNTTLGAVADALDVDVRTIAALNPHLSRGITPPGEIYGVRVPVGGSATVVDVLAETLPDRVTDD